MNVRWIVELTREERQELEALTRGGKLGARKMKRAQVLLMSDNDWQSIAIADALTMGSSTVYRTRKKFVEGGVEHALNDAPRSGAARKLSEKDEATLIALACSNAPAGCAKWTTQLLADKLVGMTEVDELSAETVRRRLKEKKIKPWQHKMWLIPKINFEFIARMEDVLSLYGEPCDEDMPVVCFDETPVQLIGETRCSIPAGEGQPERIDYEYRRNGTANIFMIIDRHRGWRHAEVTPRRTAVDFALQMRALADEHYPDATKIRVVMDNLNTHRVASLYQAFEPAEARRLAERLEFHFTPKHASWLNMVEIEIGVLNQQCLDRRIPSREILAQEVEAWRKKRNTEGATIKWLFDIEKARTKFARRYPAPVHAAEQKPE